MMVYVSRTNSTQKNTYHTEKCRNLPSKYRLVEKAQAKNWNMTECKVCAGDVEHSHTGFTSLRSMVESDEI